MKQRPAKRVLLLGWDAADWQIIRHLIDAGLMPHLKKLIDQGVMGNLATLPPSISPMLWTSIATGKRADRHGVCSFFEPRADAMGIRRIARTSLHSLPLWAILQKHGLKSAVVNWYATHPASSDDGIVISDYFCFSSGKDFDSWPFDPASVSPPSLHEVMKDLRVHPSDLIMEQVEFFIPNARQIDQAKDERFWVLTSHLCECATVHAAGTYLAENADWDLLAVYFDTIDRLSHEFMWYRAPKMEHVDEQDFLIYCDVVDRCYMYHDFMLGRYLQLVGPETTTIIVSDHGFFNDHLRPKPIVNKEVRPLLSSHRQFGILAAGGPELKGNEPVFGATVLDLTPTILTLLGVPVGKDMEGRVLSQIFSGQVTPEYIDSHEQQEGMGKRENTAEEDPWAAQEAIRQLVDLGYVAPPPEDSAKALEMAEVERLRNLSSVHFGKGEYGVSESLLRELLGKQPNDTQSKLDLAKCRMMLDDPKECLFLLDEVFIDNRESAQAHQAYGLVELVRENWAMALAHFEAAVLCEPALPMIHHQIGWARLRLNHLKEAEAAFRNSLELDGDSPHSYDALGLTLYIQRHYPESELCFLKSLACLYCQPLVHYHLGLAQAAQGKLEDAVLSLERALKFDPDLREASLAMEEVQVAKGGLAPRKSTICQ